MMLSNNLTLCFPLLLLPSIFPSIRDFYNELALCIRWPKYGSFSIRPSNDYSGLIWSPYQVWAPYEKILSMLIYLSFFSKIYLRSGNIYLLHCIPNVLLSPRYIEGTQYICFIYLFKERVSSLVSISLAEDKAYLRHFFSADNTFFLCVIILMFQ